ncbi:hypothetical protein RI129_009648 [Pyrocoelia pectoralis]|uniref:Uncharacterized protein n=1 Tax=Pyrocoelia pectoralis TaxID=417401 RepID=A0AAN7V9Q8_9COLE
MGATFLVLGVLAVSIATVSGQNCEPTFQDNQVEIESNGRTITGTVRGCFIGTQLPNVNGNPFSINIKGQVIPSLNKGAISNIQHIFKLNIIHNRIEIIKEGAFQNLPGLSELQLHHNHITTVESYAFENLLSVVIIYLQNNNIEVVRKDTFVNLPNLLGVYLNHNNLKRFDQDWFVSTPLLDRIVLTNNQITSIQDAAFQHLRTLTVISLRNNKINYIHPEAFYGLNQLDEVTLGGNQLTSFNINLSHLSVLYRLDLGYNKITYLSTEVLNAIRYSMKELFVQSNPIQCSCADELISWAAKNNIKLFWKCENKEVYCVLPLSGENKCVKRSSNEFDLATFQNFESECVI